jgi:predicted phosphodiesterase
MVSDFLRNEGRELAGGLTFYARFFGDHFKTYSGGRSKSYSFRVPIPFTAEKLMFLVADLHLHLFPHSAADNFLEPGRHGDSLASRLITLVDLVARYSARCSDAAELYQLGDCYELWESAILLCFAAGQSFDRLFTAIGSRLALSQALMDGARQQLRSNLEQRHLENLLEPACIRAISQTQTRWDHESLRPIWQEIKSAIEKVQVVPDNGPPTWRGQSIFNGSGGVRPFGQWTIVGGNHDSFVTDTTPISRGPNHAIFIEHGHLRDDSNSPEKMLSGIFWTALSTALELKGVGDEGKRIETDRRPMFIKNAADVNLRPDYPFRKKGGSGPDYYSVIVTGHTHRKYVALLREHPSLPGQYEQQMVFHKDPWPAGVIEQAKAILNPRLLAYGLGDLSAELWLANRLAATIQRLTAANR